MAALPFCHSGFLEDDERHRALAPFRVRTRDDRHLEDIGVGSEFYSLSDEDTFM